MRDRFIRSLLGCLVILFVVVPQAGLAARRVDPTEVVATSVDIMYRKKMMTRDIFCLDGVPGLGKQRGATIRFTPFKEKIRRLRKKQKKSKIKLFKLLNRSGVAACEALLVSPPTPTPTPSETPAPSPSGTPGPTPDPFGYISPAGDVTPLGKQVFEIPAELPANVHTGTELFQYYCLGCHEERVNRTFTNLRENIVQAPMYYTEDELPNSDLAHITAYLNRYRYPVE